MDAGRRTERGVRPHARAAAARLPRRGAGGAGEAEGPAGRRHTWFSLGRKEIPPLALPEAIDGFRFVLGSSAEAKWWISSTLTTGGGETFSLVLTDAAFPAGRPVHWVLPFERFLVR